jgi:hypothetical protein
LNAVDVPNRNWRRDVSAKNNEDDDQEENSQHEHTGDEGLDSHPKKISGSARISIALIS